MAEIPFIIPGTYKKKADPNANPLAERKIEAIRVLGEDPQRPGYWLTNPEGSIPEYVLLEDYEFLVRDGVSEYMGNGFKKNSNKLFEGFDTIAESIVSEQQHEVEEVYQQPVQQPTSQRQYIAQPKVPTIPVQQHDPFLQGIIEKFRLSSPVRKQVQLTINLPFDINRVKESINLLGLSVADVSKYISSTITDNPNALQNLISNTITEMLISNTNSEPFITESIPQEIAQVIEDKYFDMLDSSNQTIDVPKMLSEKIEQEFAESVVEEIENSIQDDEEIIPYAKKFELTDEEMFERMKSGNPLLKKEEPTQPEPTIDLETEIENADNRISNLLSKAFIS